MYPQKLILTTLMMISCIFIASVPTKSYAKGSLEVYMPEMITRDYPFMHTVAELLANTNHKITAPEADIKLYKDYSFDIKVKNLYRKNRSYHNPEIDFKPDGSYVLVITYRVNSYASDGSKECVFYVDNQRFTTSDYLKNYFIGCKREKVLYKFLFPGLLTDRFWSFEIKNGKVTHAYYYYDQSNLDFMDDLVYDLINKSFIRYGDLSKQYPHLL